MLAGLRAMAMASYPLHTEPSSECAERALRSPRLPRLIGIPVGADEPDRYVLETQNVGRRAVHQPIVAVRGIDEEWIGHHRVLIEPGCLPLRKGPFRRKEGARKKIEAARVPVQIVVDG